MLLSLGLYWTAWDRLYAGLKLGRAPRTKETLPDFLKWRRVTRPPLIFRGLTGSQRTPGFWGVTFIVNNQGIEANPDKIKVVLDMLPLSNIKDIQHLTGRIVALSRFVHQMLAFLSGSEKGLLVGRTLPGGVHSTKNLPELSPHSSKPFQGRTPHSLHGHFRLCN